MTPDSVLKAMADALAEKYTTSGYERHSRFHRTLEERLDQGMMKTFEASDGMLSIRAVTPREAAVEAMNVVGPILEVLFQLVETAKEMAKSHKEFIDEWARHDVDAHTQEVQYVMESLIGKVEVQEPADWAYLSQFSATPSEIHNILRVGLHPNVLKNFIDEVKAGKFN
jgi:hypothetical protein